MSTLRGILKSLPEKVRYVIIGGFSSLIIGWFVYNIIYYLNPIPPRATSSWFIAYLFAVWQQHGMHWKFTFENRSLPYFQSLRNAYGAYSIGLIFSTVVNYFLTESEGINIQIAWLISSISGVAFNFVLLRKMAFQ
jgi:putative flippase GtrA